LKENKQWNELHNIARKYYLNRYLDKSLSKLATIILVDAKNPDIAQTLRNRLLSRVSSDLRDVLKWSYLLAIKLGYKDHIEMFSDIEEQKPIIPAKQTQIQKETYDRDIVVPIEKIYFLDDIPQDAKCMVTGLELDFNIDTIVVCPFCSAWAKKELLKSWLDEKSTCPVCQRELHIEDCPTVRINTK
jgi:hypothetical protein